VSNNKGAPLHKIIQRLIDAEGVTKVGREIRRLRPLIGQQRYSELLKVASAATPQPKRDETPYGDAGKAFGDGRDATIMVLVDFLVAGYGGKHGAGKRAVTRAIKDIKNSKPRWRYGGKWKSPGESNRATSHGAENALRAAYYRAKRNETEKFQTLLKRTRSVIALGAAAQVEKQFGKNHLGWSARGVEKIELRPNDRFIDVLLNGVAAHLAENRADFLIPSQ
jgi:hypothetical protein